MWVQRTPKINPIYGLMDRPCPNDTKMTLLTITDRETNRQSLKAELKTNIKD